MPIIVSDRQANRDDMRDLDVPWLVVERYLEGPRRDRPLGAHPNTVFQSHDTGEAWVWLHPPWQVGLLTSRPTEMRTEGVVWWAKDVDQLFIWI